MRVMLLPLRLVGTAHGGGRQQLLDCDGDRLRHRMPASCDPALVPWMQMHIHYTFAAFYTYRADQPARST
jgi:hypothetical protein